AHQDRMRSIVVDAKLIPNAMLLTDAMHRDPRSGGIRDVVVPTIEHVPTGHRALLDAVREPASFRLLEERNEDGLEHLEVLVHLQLRVTPHEPTYGIGAEQDGCVEHADHEVVLLAALGLVRHEHV